MSLNDEMLKELESQLKQAEKTFRDNVKKLDNKELKIDMLQSFEDIKAGKISVVELNKKTTEWQSISDK
jgi:hypothetical protein